MFEPQRIQEIVAKAAYESNKEQKALAFDSGKLDLSLVPAEWVEALVQPFQAGIDKNYPRDNWRLSLNTDEHNTFKNKRLTSALRHISAYRKSDIFDEETGLHHLLLGAWNLLCVFWYDDNQKEKSNVPN